jgi:hypothetical protein
MRKNASLQLDKIFVEERYQLTKASVFHRKVKRRANRLLPTP